MSDSLASFRLRSTFLTLILKGGLLKQKLNNGKEVKSSKNWRKILTKLERFWKSISRTNHYKLFKEGYLTLHARKYMAKKKDIHGLFRKNPFYICILAGVNIHFFTINFKKTNFVIFQFCLRKKLKVYEELLLFCNNKELLSNDTWLYFIYFICFLIIYFPSYSIQLRTLFKLCSWNFNNSVIVVYIQKCSLCPNNSERTSEHIHQENSVLKILSETSNYYLGDNILSSVCCGKNATPTIALIER